VETYYLTVLQANPMYSSVSTVRTTHLPVYIWCGRLCPNSYSTYHNGGLVTWRAVCFTSAKNGSLLSSVSCFIFSDIANICTFRSKSLCSSCSDHDHKALFSLCGALYLTKRHIFHLSVTVYISVSVVGMHKVQQDNLEFLSCHYFSNLQVSLPDLYIINYFHSTFYYMI
jgi:hypothetical protein